MPAEQARRSAPRDPRDVLLATYDEMWPNAPRAERESYRRGVDFVLDELERAEFLVIEGGSVTGEELRALLLERGDA